MPNYFKLGYNFINYYILISHYIKICRLNPSLFTRYVVVPETWFPDMKAWPRNKKDWLLGDMKDSSPCY